MKFIATQQAPPELIGWIAQQRKAGVNLHFNNLGTVFIGEVQRDVKKAVLESRIKDQGYICAYTMRRIWPAHNGTAGNPIEANCHLEHLIPRTVSDALGRPEQTVEYRNMVACFPKNGGDKSHGFGAPVREDKALAISPCDQGCERHIRYHQDGVARPSAPVFPEATDPVWVQINETLKLNAEILVRSRQQAIRSAGVSLADDRGAISSIAEADRLAAGIVSFRRGGKLAPYCVAIAHAARDHARTLEKLRRKQVYARRQQP